MPNQEFYKEQVAEAEKKQQIYAETIAYLRTDKRLQSFFSQYEKESVKSFIEQYAKTRSTWITSGEGALNYQKGQESKWKKNAFKILNHIQQKKLLNLQCKWRAEQVQLTGVEICFDFQILANNVLDCDLVEDITDEEIDAYITYLHEHTDEESVFNDYLINGTFSDIKDGFFKVGEDYLDYPSWYYFYDNHFGTTHLMHLPDTRADKEEV